MSDDIATKSLACVGIIILAVIGVVGGALMQGWALSTLWAWFIVPLFGVPLMPVGYAIGVSLLVGTLLFNTSTPKSNMTTSEQIGLVIGKVFVAPILSVFMGWIVLQFM